MNFMLAGTAVENNLGIPALRIDNLPRCPLSAYICKTCVYIYRDIEQGCIISGTPSRNIPVKYPRIARLLRKQGFEIRCV